MRKIFRNHYLMSALLAVFLMMLSLHGAEAQSVISGDAVCGSSSGSACKLTDLKKITQGVLTAIIAIGLPLLLVFIAYRLVKAWFLLQQGNSNAYREAVGKILQGILGFIVIVALLGGVLLSLLKFVGVQQFPLKLLQLISGAFVPHAYAQEGLPNPLGVSNLYDFILSVLRLVMRFFIYPAFIVIWVWTGLQFVMAQGNPDALSKAKKWLLWAFVSTLVVMMLQGLLLAIRASVNTILPGSTSSLYLPEGIEEA